MAELEASAEGAYDPFGKDVAVASLIMQMKIYDVLMTILSIENPGLAKDLDKAHINGIVMGLGPQFSGFAERDEDSQPDSA